MTTFPSLRITVGAVPTTARAFTLLLSPNIVYTRLDVCPALHCFFLSSVSLPSFRDPISNSGPPTVSSTPSTPPPELYTNRGKLGGALVSGSVQPAIQRSWRDGSVVRTNFKLHLCSCSLLLCPLPPTFYSSPGGSSRKCDNPNPCVTQLINAPHQPHQTSTIWADLDNLASRSSTQLSSHNLVPPPTSIS